MLLLRFELHNSRQSEQKNCRDSEEPWNESGASRKKQNKQIKSRFLIIKKMNSKWDKKIPRVWVEGKKRGSSKKYSLDVSAVM